MKRFDVMCNGHYATERDYCDDGEFVDAKVAQSLYEALEALLDFSGPIPFTMDSGIDDVERRLKLEAYYALSRARSESGLGK